MNHKAQAEQIKLGKSRCLFVAFGCTEDYKRGFKYLVNDCDEWFLVGLSISSAVLKLYRGRLCCKKYVDNAFGPANVRNL